MPHISLGTHPDDLDVARQRIDEEIARLEARIVELKTDRNTFTTVARVPADVMEEIFVTTAQSGENQEIGKTALMLSWVCGNWRDLALQLSTLWNHIDFLNIEWVEYALARTRNRDLHLSFDFGQKSYEDAKRLVSLSLEHTARIKTFNLSHIRDWCGGSDDSKLDARLMPLWTMTSPVLVELRLFGRNLPSPLSSGLFPALEDLSLISCQFDWESLPTRTGLKSLQIRDPHLKTSVYDLVDKLRIIGPTLESLSLHGILQSTVAPLNLASSEPRQVLPKIQYFEIQEDHAPFVTFILNHLTIPSGVEYIDILLPHGEEEQIDTVRALVACRGTENWPADTVQFDIQYDGLVISMEDSADRSISILLDYYMTGTQGYVPLFSIFPPLTMKTLVLPGNICEGNTSVLLGYLDAPGTVERLRVVQVFAPMWTSILYNQNQKLREITGFKDALDMKMDCEAKVQCRDVITFHELTTLEYYGDTLADSSGQYPYDDSEGHEGDITAFWCSVILSDKKGRLGHEYFQILGEWLRWRKAVGLGVKNLVFTNMNIPQAGYLEALCEGVQVKCMDVVHVTEKGQGSKVLGFEVNPGA